MIIAKLSETKKQVKSPIKNQSYKHTYFKYKNRWIGKEKNENSSKNKSEF